jgi:hypothetical protein
MISQAQRPQFESINTFLTFVPSTKIFQSATYN